ncbi:5841_t:CDS:2, partial [Racocetra fulgida]
MSNKKLPSKNDPERTTAEQEALKTAERATQFTEALKEGRLPTTEQITTTIDSIHDNDTFHESARGMSPLGKKVLANTEKFLESTKNLLAEKNAGDELQNTVYYGNKAAREISVDEHIAACEPSVKEIWQKTLLVINEKSQIPQLLISNPEFRKLVNDINCVFQEALSVTVPGNEEVNVETPTTDDEKSPQEISQHVKRQTRESVYPVAKAGAGIVGPQIREFGEGKKSLQEAAGEGMRSLATSLKNRVTSYNLSPERRERIITRFKNLIFETQKRPEYQEALTDIIGVISRISEYTQEVVNQASETAKSTNQQVPSLKIAQQNAKELLENFANHRSLDDLIAALKNMGTQIKQDEELRHYLKELQHFVLSSLRDHEFVQRTDYNEHGSRLIENGRRILLENYRETTQKIAEEAAAFNDGLQEDRTTRQWTHDLECLVRDIFLDDKGRPTIKFELIKDFRKILSIVAEKLRFIPLPKLEKYYEYSFDNIVLHVSDIIPKHLHISLTSDINMERESEDVVQNTARLKRQVENVITEHMKKAVAFIQDKIARVQTQVIEGQQQAQQSAAKQTTSPVSEEKLKAREVWRSEAFTSK